ncbi:hypothetical protein [Streptomyces sp. NPDC058855]|uniref:hypothetical protein n=1 Tax=Streptomyces sp. NPDC058855 TaxID=3346651 RepID=UPI0036CFDA3D
MAPPVIAGATALPITHRNWTDEWVTVRCRACGREDDWPHPELGCACGAVLRVPVRAVDGTEPEGDCPDHGPGASGAPGVRGASATSGYREAAGAAEAPGPRAPDPRDGGSGPAEETAPAPGGTGPVAGNGDGAPVPPVAGTAPVDGAPLRREPGAPRPEAPLTGGPGPVTYRPGTAAGAGTPSRATGLPAPSGTGAGDPAGPPPRTAARTSGSDWFGPSPAGRTTTDPGTGGPHPGEAGDDGPPAGGPRGGDPLPEGPTAAPGADPDRAAPRSPAPRPFTERHPADLPPPLAAPRPAPLRAAFRPVTIRTARDAVAAAAGYLRWLGFRDVVQPEERPASGVDLRGPGLVAQVNPSTRPAGLRAVECLWLTGLSSSAVGVFFSLAGYTPEARARAAEIGLPLFVLDLTGTPQAVNRAADELAEGGA